MEISLVKTVVTTTQETHNFDIDFKKLAELILEEPIKNNITKEQKRDLIDRIECAAEYYLSKLLHIDIESLLGDDGYDIEDNKKEIDKIIKEFTKYIKGL